MEMTISIIYLFYLEGNQYSNMYKDLKTTTLKTNSNGRNKVRIYYYDNKLFFTRKKQIEQ